MFQNRMGLPSWCTAKESLFTAKMVKLEAGILWKTAILDEKILGVRHVN
jgi:hypothetical protein